MVILCPLIFSYKFLPVQRSKGGEDGAERKESHQRCAFPYIREYTKALNLIPKEMLFATTYNRNANSSSSLAHGWYSEWVIWCWLWLILLPSFDCCWSDLSSVSKRRSKIFVCCVVSMVMPSHRDSPRQYFLVCNFTKIFKLFYSLFETSVWPISSFRYY